MLNSVISSLELHTTALNLVFSQRFILACSYCTYCGLCCCVRFLKGLRYWLMKTLRIGIPCGQFQSCCSLEHKQTHIALSLAPLCYSIAACRIDSLDCFLVESFLPLALLLDF